MCKRLFLFCSKSEGDMKWKRWDNAIDKGACWIWLEFCFEGIKTSLNNNQYKSLNLGLKKISCPSLEGGKTTDSSLCEQTKSKGATGDPASKEMQPPPRKPRPQLGIPPTTGCLPLLKFYRGLSSWGLILKEALTIWEYSNQAIWNGKEFRTIL